MPTENEKAEAECLRVRVRRSSQAFTRVLTDLDKLNNAIELIEGLREIVVDEELEALRDAAQALQNRANNICRHRDASQRALDSLEADA